MAVRGRSVKNKRNAAGELTGSPGTVYDVNVKYKTSGKSKTYSKKGFASKKEAQEHEALMRIRLQNPCYVPLAAVDAKQTVTGFLDKWIKQRAADLRPSTFASYQSIIRLHIVPYIGDARMCDVTPEVLDVLFRKLQEENLSVNTVKYVKRILSVSFEHARKYHYIETNPVHDTITRFGKAGSTPAPYTVQQMGQLLALAAGTSWELIIVLGGLYGLRISEILGLRWENVDLNEGCFDVKEQLPYHIPPTTTTISEMAPVKAGERSLPITEITQPLFENQKKLQVEQRRYSRETGTPYFENDLVISKETGAPLIRENISANFGDFLRRNNMPHIRFHDLRHATATNIHGLTGDFFTAGQVLGHSLKGMGAQMSVPGGLEAVTERYVSVRLDRKREVLTIYHNAVLGNVES